MVRRVASGTRHPGDKSQLSPSLCPQLGEVTSPLSTPILSRVSREKGVASLITGWDYRREDETAQSSAWPRPLLTKRRSVSPTSNFKCSSRTSKS